MKIPLSAPDITEAEIDAVTAVLRTPHLSLGPELEAFEHALAAYHSVPEAIAVRIFDPLVTGREGGNGLGLALARRIAVAHGGNVVLGESQNGGAAFLVELPGLT